MGLTKKPQESRSGGKERLNLGQPAREHGGISSGLRRPELLTVNNDCYFNAGDHILIEGGTPAIVNSTFVRGLWVHHVKATEISPEKRKLVLKTGTRALRYRKASGT